MPKAPVIIRKKKDPVIVVQKENKPLKPPPPKTIPVKPEKPKGPPPVDKDYQYQEYLKEIESIHSPNREIASVCLYLCTLINENRTTSTLFPLKDEVLKRIYESGHECLMVSYIKRGDRLTHRLTQEAREKWESETGGKKGLMHMYRTPECFVQSERGYYDLYQFHIVIEPFRFMFYMPVETAPWVDEERLLKPRLYTNVTPEHGLLRGKTIKISRKSINTNDEQIGEELKRFLDARIT